MKKTLLLVMGLWALSALAGAAVIQDWTGFKPQVNVGTYDDGKGSKLEIAQAAGPAAGEKSLKISAALVQWGGVWNAAEANLSTTTAIRFKAKVSAPGLFQVGLTDDKKVMVIATIRVVSDDWEDFTIPLSDFTKSPWQDKDVPKDAKIRLSKITTLQLAPQAQGPTTFWIGPISAVSGKVAARTGMPDRSGKNGLVVQDFILLEKNAFGPFTDKESGTTLGLTLVRDPEAKGARLASFQYNLKKKGWCGEWIRVGDDWNGQDWRGAKTMTLQVDSDFPLSLELGFNDAKQNSYTATTPQTQGKGWETLVIPFSSFQLNPYFQPPEAKKGAPQDLSKLETFNLAPKTEGKHSFKVRLVTIQK
jgi:hypothetical protein